MFNDCKYPERLSILMLMNLGSCDWSHRRCSIFSYEQCQLLNDLCYECHKCHERAYKYFDRSCHIDR